MDLENKHKIELTVTEILKSADIDSVTERNVRAMASHKLGIDLSVLSHKILVRQIIESFLLSTDIDDNSNGPDKENEKDGNFFVGTSINGGVGQAEEEEETTPVIAPPVAKESAGDWCRVICKLSNKRDVAIRGSGGETVVSIREFFWKDGKQIPSPKCISLSNDQWSNFRKSIPAIEEAIAKVESRLRSEFEKKRGDDRYDRSEPDSKQNGAIHGRSDMIQKDDIRLRPRVVASGKRAEDVSTAPSLTRQLIPMEIIRFDGKNYQQWADRMGSYLNRLNVAYVLSDPCPSAVGVIDRELAQTLTAVQRWVDDDHICRQNILNSLCDNLFGHYSLKTGTGKDLWDELKLVYLNEEHGAKVSLVKKYIEFQIVEEKPVFEQVQEFHGIADSLIASGMYVEEKFHVNVIISKLPPSWKPCSVQLMKEDYLPVWMLMNHLKAEEESRGKGNKGEGFLPRADVPVFQPAKKLGPTRVPMKKPGGITAVNHEPDRDRKIKFCTICKKKGHVMEQCWFRKTGGKDSSESGNVVAGGNVNGAAE